MSEDVGKVTSRIAYLESIRGLAAVQVLLLHAFAMFVPGLVFSHPASGIAGSIHLSPLYFLYDGYSAVYVFFALSGFVLSRSFASQTEHPFSAVVARAFRLGLPALAAAFFAAIVLALFGRHNDAIVALTGSDWTATQWNPELSIPSILRDGIINALFLGYPGLSGLPFAGSLQQPVEQSFLAPFWTLSIEFYGSLLVLGFCILAKGPRWLWWIAISAAAVFFSRSAYLCFVLGHAVAMLGPNPIRARWPVWLSVAAMVGGVCVCVLADVWQPSWLRALCNTSAFPLFPAQWPQQQQKAYGAMVFLAGLVSLAPAQDALSRAWLVRWSQLSFPLYLVHWPILFGPTAVLFVTLSVSMPAALAAVVTIVAGIAMSFAASVMFLPLDRFALDAARRLRRYLSGQSRRAAVAGLGAESAG